MQNSSTQPLIIAHRGARGEAPENTLAAFRLGLAQGCTGIELDVHLTKDGEIVVCHDDTVNRTTDGTGAIHDMTVSELKKLDAGAWFGEAYRGERIPLLCEVFELTPPHVMINVEIKESYGRRLEPALLELLSQYDRLGNTVVSSFDHKSLLYLKLLEPRVKIGLLYDIDAVRHADLARFMNVPVYSLHPRFKRLSAEETQDAIRQGLRVYPFTINDEAQMSLALDYGVSGIITDYPERLRLLMERRSAVAEKPGV